MTAAVITASVAVIVAVVAQVATWWREKAARRYDRRRDAMLDAQKAALQLRRTQRDYGLALRRALTRSRSGPVADPQVDATVLAARDDADGLLTIYLARVDDDGVVAAFTAWRHAADQRFISIEDVSADEEDEAWNSVNHAVRRSLSR